MTAQYCTHKQSFWDIFGFDQIEEISYEQTIDAIKKVVKNSDTFLQRTLQLVEERRICIGENIEMTDGKFYERDFILYSLKINTWAICGSIMISLKEKTGKKD
jgi:hypothetical protein